MSRARGNFVKRELRGDPTGQTGAKRRGGTYRAFVPEAVSKLELSLPGSLALRLEDASARVRTLNDSTPRLTALEALARQLLRSEALASSRIEGLSVGHRRIAREDFRAASDHAVGGHVDSRAADIVGNIRAMERAVEIGSRAKPLSTEDVLEIHRTLLRFGEDSNIAGKLRTSQGWIGGANLARAEYVPPPPDEVRRLLEDVCWFLSRDDIPPLAQAAVGHAQFETVHPFADGNGRTGRCLIHAVLRRRGLTSHYVPPISVLLAARRKEYFGGLTRYRDADGLNDWLEYFADVTVDAADEAVRLAGKLDDLEDGWLRRFSRPPRSDAAVRRVMKMLPAHPVLDARVVQAELGISDVAAGNALNQLDDAGVLQVVTRGVRGRRVWECRDLFDLINKFESDLTR